MAYRYFFLCSLFFITTRAWCFDAYDAIHFEVYYRIDSTHQLSQADVLKDDAKWMLIKDPKNFNLGHNDYNVWLLLRLKNKKIGKDYLLTIENAHLDTLVLYKYGKSHTQVVSTGDRQVFSKREHQYNMFVFTLPDSCDFFLLRTTTQGSLSMPITVKGVNEYMVDANVDTMMLALFFGVVFLSILLNIMLYYRITESIYLFYILCLLGNAILNAVDSGVAFQFLWPNHPGINQYVGLFYACVVMNLLFNQKFLSLKEIAPVLNKVYYALFIYVIVLAVINLIGYYNISIQYLVYYFYLSSFLFLFSGIYIYFIKKYRPAFYYMLAWGIYSVSGVVYMLASEGLLPFTFLTKNALKIGNILEIIFLFMAVVDKIYDLGKAKEHSDYEALRLAEENREILLARNNALEKFANFTAHNIRGPVSSIMGLTNLFQMVKQNDDETNKVVGFIRQSALKLDEVVKDMILLLTLNNKEESQREELLLAPAYYEAKEFFLSTLPEDTEVLFEESFFDLKIYAEEAVLKFAFDQLLNNSYKFREVSRTLKITVRQEEEGRYRCIYFSDNGIGFDSARYKNDVFGLYKRFHVNGQGKGLGLYFIKEYMRKIKGKVGIESRQDEGTVVRLCFEKV
ncbi:MAG: multi-sensor signal transduction multi-kinase [Chitinophagaceae bacterium]|nr:multi-sensor signal transduction multi-kinase [Chitinophagaceae bacterium]